MPVLFSLYSLTANRQEAKWQLRLRDSALMNHVTGSHRVRRLVECTRLCATDFDCDSFNYKPAAFTDGSEHNCQLNKEVYFQHETDMVVRPNWRYYDLVDTA